MRHKLLSIIVPVYQVEDYIRKCMESLIVPNAEQLALLDIVIINDGTPDRSADIAREYEAKYPSVIRVIDQENSGHGGAWNRGTELAVGKYLFYLDSDDWFDTAEFSRLIDYLDHCDTDMVLLDKQNYDAATRTFEKVTDRHSFLEPERIYDGNRFDWVGCDASCKMTYAHDTVYRTSMMQQYLPLYCEHVMYDDVSLQVVPIAIAKDFVYTRIDVYRYLRGRLGQSFDPKVRAMHAADDVTEVLKFVLRWMDQHYDATPAEGTHRAWLDYMYDEICSYHYLELATYAPEVARPRLVEWDRFVRTHYPNVKLAARVYSYRNLPFQIAYVVFQAERLFIRIVHWIKRHLTN